MRTLRAPECAAGEHFEFSHMMLDVQQSALLMQPEFIALSPSDSQTLLADFSRAKQQIAFIFRAKLSFWRDLPWVLLGLAHHNEGVARQCGKRALQPWEALPPEVTPHPLASQMLNPGRARTELQDFIDGTPLHQLPWLELLTSRFRFVAVAERWIESQHALTKKHLNNAPHAGVVHIAFSGVQRPLRERLADPYYLASLAEACELSKNPWQCLQSCGLASHPSIQKKF